MNEQVTEYRDYNAIPKFWRIGAMLGDEVSGVVLTFCEERGNDFDDDSGHPDWDPYTSLWSAQHGFEEFLQETCAPCLA